MNQTNTNKLVKSYPKIFKNVGGSRQVTCMAFGFECGDGWYDLLNDLCANIQKLMDGYEFEVVADQVKEKFGALRFYYHFEGYHGVPEEVLKAVEKLIDLAEHLSNATCEKCGDEAELSIRGMYYQTLCATCRGTEFKLVNNKK